MPFFKEFGMTEDNILNHYQVWKKEGAFSVEDYLWYIFNLLLDENSKQSVHLKDFYSRNVQIYSQMISFRRKVESKKANEIQKLYNSSKVNLDLESCATSTFKFDFVIIGTNDCEQSKKISGKSITKEQAILNNVIPYEKCSRKQGCVCLMSMVPKRNSNGSLIDSKSNL